MNCSFARALSLGLVYAAIGASAAACGGGDSTGATGGTDGGPHPDATSGKDSGGSHDSSDGSDDGGSMDAAGQPGDDSSTGTEGGDDMSTAGDGSTGDVDATADGSAGDGSSDGASTGDGTSDGSGDGPDAISDASANGDVVSDGAGDGPDASDARATCNFNGTWGSEITMNVSWMPAGVQSIILAPGSGVIKQWLLSTRTQSGNSLTDTTFVCGIQLPDFTGTQIAGSENYGIRFPNSLFDNGYLSSFTIQGTVTSSTPGSMYTSSASAALIGLTLTNATTSPWPATITTQVNQDMDQKPGVTANVATGSVSDGGTYSDPPVDFLKIARADKLYLAIRQVTQISATITDCDHASGSVTIPQLPSGSGSYAINSHIIGCEIAGTTTSCNANQIAFVDSNGPIFTPSTTTFSSARLAAGATCMTVRAQFP